MFGNLRIVMPVKDKVAGFVLVYLLHKTTTPIMAN
jgi:hypothetical protein